MDMESFETMREKLSLSELSKPAIVGLAVIMVMVAVMAGRYAIDTATAKDFAIDREASELSDATAGSDEDVGRRTVFVHVTGAVANPGIYELDEGARVASAVREAGGFADDAEQEACNLARIVSDGEQIRIPTHEEVEGQAQAGVPSDSVGSPSGNPTGQPLNINTATAEQLEALPGVGPATAGKIVADRESNGPFATTEDLMRVKGIGEKKLAELDGLISVS